MVHSRINRENDLSPEFECLSDEFMSQTNGCNTFCMPFQNKCCRWNPFPCLTRQERVSGADNIRSFYQYFFQDNEGGGI